MTRSLRSLPRRRAPLAALALLLLPAGCVGSPGVEDVLETATFTPREQECMARAMYFESNRSSADGMLAVGTVVMNRVDSGEFPNDVCSVVAQHRQFAPGVMSRPMNAGRELAMEMAGRTLQGERHAPVQTAKYFHTAGLSYGYNNMHYRAIAGGNAFYERISPRRNPGFQHASQAEVRAAQRSRVAAASRTTTAAAPASATALAPTMAEASSPFASLWRNLTQPRPNRSTGPVGAEPDVGAITTLVGSRPAAASPATSAAAPANGGTARVDAAFSAADGAAPSAMPGLDGVVRALTDPDAGKGGRVR